MLLRECIQKILEHLFSQVLTSRYALLDEERYDAVRMALGLPAKGMHYSPLISPMLGGSQTSHRAILAPIRLHRGSARSARTLESLSRVG